MFLSRENHLYKSVLFITALMTALAMAGLTGCAGTSEGDPSTYTVRFDADGGSPAPGPQTVANNGKVTEPPNPSKGGFIFEGWYADVETQLWVFNADTVTGNITLHAKWREVTGEAEYNKEALEAAGEITLTAKDRDNNDVALTVEVGDDTIAVSVNGGAPIEYPSAITDSTIILIGAGEGGGNATLGYIINDDGTLTITGGLDQIAGANLAPGPVTSEENENLTQPEITFIVRFDAQGGTPAPAQQTVAKNGKAAGPSPAPARAGYALDGWYSDAAYTDTNRWNFDVNTVTAPVTLYAKWIAVAENSFVVRFDSTGGGQVADQVIISGNRAARPANPARPDHTFDNWYTEAAYTTLYDFAAPVTADITLYAKWTAIVRYTVTFNAQGGTPTPGVQNVVSGEKAAGPSPAPAKTGYVLDGWYTEAAYTNRWEFAVNTVTAAVTLYAKWTEVAADSFVVSFDSTGGSEVNDQTVASGGKATRPANPTRSEFTFDNWYTEAAYTTVYDFETPVTGDITLYAKWTAIVRYAVAFDAQGGSPEPATQNVASGGKATGPSPAPAKTGFILEGWYTEAAYTTRWSFDNIVTAAVVLYAKWTEVAADSFVVSFDSREGSDVADQIVISGGKAARPANPTRSEFTFDDWYTQEALTTVYNFDTPVTEDITLYAKWTAINSYRVTFNAQGGSPTPNAQDVVSGEKAAGPSPAPAKEGYTLDGWYRDAAYTTNPWNFAVDTVTAAITLYAKWTAVAADSFVVSFDSAGGSEVADQTVTSGGNADRPDDPTRSDYIFVNWYKEAAYTTVYDFDDPVTQNITLYAKWTAIEVAAYTVTFNAQGGSPIPAPQNVVSGEMATAPSPVPTKEGYTLDGWYTEAEGTNRWDFAVNTVTGNITLHAKWTAVAPNVFVVSFSSAGGSEVADQSVTSGGKATRPDNPTRQGYDFVDWYTEAAHTTVYNFDDPVTSHITLYADWSLTFVPVSGIVSTIPASATTGYEINLNALTTVNPGNATDPNIVWTVRGSTTTGVTNDDLADGIFQALYGGTLDLTATIVDGTAVGNPFVKNDISIVIVKPVTNITGVPLRGIKDVPINLSGATVIPGDASYDEIVWSVEAPGGAGLTSASTAPFTPTGTGSVTLIATIVNGWGMGVDYEQKFNITIGLPGVYDPEIGFGNETFLKVRANRQGLPIESGETMVVTGSSYYIELYPSSGYSGIVWYINGTKSPVTGVRLTLDTNQKGLVQVTVEAYNDEDGDMNTGTFRFDVQ